MKRGGVRDIRVDTRRGVGYLPAIVKKGTGRDDLLCGRAIRDETVVSRPFPDPPIHHLQAIPTAGHPAV
jgi:hypothetical protein